MLGYPDQGLILLQEAVVLARDLSHPYTLATALGNQGLALCSYDDVQRANELFTEAMSIAQQHGFPQLEAMVNCWMSEVLISQGKFDEAVLRLKSGLSIFEGDSSELLRLASAYHKPGRLQEAFAEVNKLQNHVARQGQHARDSELLRLKGALLSIKGDSVAAEQCFQSAIKIASRQSAKIYELTATTELASLLVQQGRRDQAYMMLSEIYNWFTEGFDTTVLKKAKAILAELHS